MVKTTPKSAPKAAKSNVASKVKAHSKATANTKKPASAISKAKDTIALKEDAEKSGKVSAGTGDLKSKRKSASDFLDEEIAPKKGKKTAAGSDESEEVHFKKPAVTGSKSTPVSSGKVTKQEGKQAQKAGEKKQLKSALKTIVTVEVESEDVEMDNIVTAKSKTVSNTKKNEKISAPATATKGKKAAATAAPKTKKKAAPVPASVIAEEAQAENSDDEDFIHGFSSSGSESEGEDDSDVEMEQDDLAAVERKRALDVKTLPTTAKDDKTVKRKLEAAKKKKDAQRGTLYLGRIPHGFYEEQMKEYFSQFGDVTRLRLARNKKTGASKHFAYIEMASKSVAEVTAETMDNYLLLGHLLQCSVVPAEKLHPDLWAGANRKWRRIPSLRIERATFGKPRSAEQTAKADKNLVKRDAQRKRKIKELGIDYEYEGFTLPKAI